MKQRWSEKLTSVLFAFYPQLRGAYAWVPRGVCVGSATRIRAGKVEFVDVSTPLTIEHYLPSGG
jgi:hypothetical protein